MDRITLRDLRHHCGRVLRRVARGESLIVTVDGQPVAELGLLRGQGVSAFTLVQRWRGVPAVNWSSFRADLDRTIDTRL